MIDIITHNWTDYTSGDLTLTESSHYGGAGGWHGWTVFDGALGHSEIKQYWLTDGVVAGWLKLDVGSGNQETIIQVSIQVNNVPEPNRAPQDFTIQGSNNDSDWTTLKTVTGETSWGDSEKRDFTLDVTGAYRYYKIDITDNNGDASYTQIAEVYLYKADAGWTGKICGVTSPAKICGIEVANIASVMGQ